MAETFDPTQPFDAIGEDALLFTTARSTEKPTPVPISDGNGIPELGTDNETNLAIQQAFGIKPFERSDLAA